MLHTTLQLCKRQNACADGYRTLKKSLPKGHTDTDLIPLTHILESNGLDDCLWSLRATVEDSKKLSRSFAIWCARQALPIWQQYYPDDDRVKNCIDIAEKFNNGEATEEERSTAESAALSAAHREARSSTRSAVDSAFIAARSAVRSAAWGAVCAARSAYRAARPTAWFVYMGEGGRSTIRRAQKEQLIKMLEAHTTEIGGGIK